MRMMFLAIDGEVYVVKIPHNIMGDTNAYLYARKKLGVKEMQITPWRWVEFNENGIAPFGFDFYEKL